MAPLADCDVRNVGATQNELLLPRGLTNLDRGKPSRLAFDLKLGSSKIPSKLLSGVHTTVRLLYCSAQKALSSSE